MVVAALVVAAMVAAAMVAAMAGLGIVLAAGAWFAVATCLVVVITPDGGLAGRLAIFGSLNFAAALGLVGLASRASERPGSSLAGAAAESKGT